MVASSSWEVVGSSGSETVGDGASTGTEGFISNKIEAVDGVVDDPEGPVEGSGSSSRFVCSQ
jgi:hypothetical protein